jgi:hypothetical protein
MERLRLFNELQKLAAWRIFVNSRKVIHREGAPGIFELQA